MTVDEVIRVKMELQLLKALKWKEIILVIPRVITSVPKSERRQQEKKESVVCVRKDLADLCWPEAGGSK